MRIGPAAVVIAVVFWLLAGTASASVRKVSFTSTVDADKYASLVVTVSPKDRCAIQKATFDTPTGVPDLMQEAGLRPKVGSRIGWRWRIGERTKPGRWTIFVFCNRSGSLRTHLVVRD